MRSLYRKRSADCAQGGPVKDKAVSRISALRLLQKGASGELWAKDVTRVASDADALRLLLPSLTDGIDCSSEEAVAAVCSYLERTV
jgi:hypothetical protein